MFQKYLFLYSTFIEQTIKISLTLTFCRRCESDVIHIFLYSQNKHYIFWKDFFVHFCWLKFCIFEISLLCTFLVLYLTIRTRTTRFSKKILVPPTVSAIEFTAIPWNRDWIIARLTKCCPGLNWIVQVQLRLTLKKLHETCFYFALLFRIFPKLIADNERSLFLK